MSITPRVNLNVGYDCNAKCAFCYYAKRVNHGFRLTTGKAKKMIKLFFMLGKRSIDFTGGEPTIKDDIFDLVSYAKNLGYKNITIITNGIRLADIDTVKKFKSSGLTDFLFSVHGHDSYTHDTLTGVEGSFVSLLHAIDNANSLGLVCRANIVVTSQNYTFLPEIVKLLITKNIKIINFIIFNPVADVNDRSERLSARYEDVAGVLRKVLLDHKSSLDRVAVRYMPICYLAEYAHLVAGHKQISYDHYDWDYLFFVYGEYGFMYLLRLMFLGLLSYPFFIFKLRRVKYILHDLVTLGSLRYIMKHLPDCKRCKFVYVCDGVWSSYLACHNDVRVKPVDGKIVLNSVYTGTLNR